MPTGVLWRVSFDSRMPFIAEYHVHSVDCADLWSRNSGQNQWQHTKNTLKARTV